MYRLVLMIFATLWLQSNLKYSESPNQTSYSSSWMVHITKGIEVAKEIAKKEGFLSVDELPETKLYHFYDLKSNDDLLDEDIYAKLFQYEEVTWLRPTKMEEISATNYGDPPGVRYVLKDSEIPLIRYHPELEDYPTVYCAGPENFILKSNQPMLFNDPIYPQQWFLRSCREFEAPGSTYYDIKLIQTWENFNVYGRGVVVLVLDHGVLSTHQDLNVDLRYSYNFLTGENDPSPLNHPDEDHGTLCAGVIAMKKNNGLCGVGIAPMVTLGGLKVREGKLGDDAITPKSLAFNAPQVDIMLRAMGEPLVNYLIKLSQDLETVLHYGITEGRRGKGVLYVFAAGNNKNRNEPTVCSGRALLNSIYTITIGGMNHDGIVSRYAERCSNIMAVLYSGDAPPYIIPTVTLGGDHDQCDLKFTGTSASSPMAAGALALVLEANPTLSWREVQHIIAWTSEIAPLTKNPGWVKNGAGFYVNLDFGFGMMSIYDMVEMAKNFTPIPSMHACELDYKSSVQGVVQFSPNTSRRIEIETTGCRGTPTEINYIEHVLLNVDIQYSYRGSIQIRLKSPKGTTVNLLEPRKQDNVDLPIEDYTFQSVHTWGENPYGKWTVDIFDTTGPYTNQGFINKVELMIYGTKDPPEHYKNGSRTYYPFEPPEMNT